MRGTWIVVAIGLCALSACGADMTSRVKSRAARDFSCNEDQTRIVDAESGVYRITGCGLVASYQCSETASLSTRCQQLYVTKADDSAAPVPAKDEAAASMAKSSP